MTDHVDDVLAVWAELRPDWYLGGMAVLGRVSRLERLMELRRVEILEPLGLTSGDVDVLASLYRNPDGQRPRDLRQSMLIGSGTLTARLDRLEADGLLERRPDPEDRRGRVLVLTARGRRLVPQVVGQLLVVENAVLAPLPPAVRERLAKDLRRVLSAAEAAASQD